jgi:integrase
MEWSMTTFIPAAPFTPRALGLGTGEALGLRWRDVDFGSGALRVHRRGRGIASSDR